MPSSIDRQATRSERRVLPESYDVHWSTARKADVVRAVRDKLISFDEARWRYLLSHSEFKSWQSDLAKRGQDDLQFDLTEVR